MGKRLVVATAEPFFFGSYIMALREGGFAVRVVTSVPEFLAALRSGEADLAVVVAGTLADWDVVEKAGVDTQSGCVAGFAAVDLVRREGKRVPAIFLTTAYYYRFVANTTVADLIDVSPSRLVAMVQKILA